MVKKMNNPYEQGKAARVEGKTLVDNPYQVSQIGFLDYLFNPFIFTQNANKYLEWNRGFHGE